MRKTTKGVLAAVAGFALLGIGTAIGHDSGPARTVTVTRTLPAVTVTATPAVTVTVQVSAPPPAPGAVIAAYHGSGNQVTPAFIVPADGNYIVTWSYSGNTDPTVGGGSNFSIAATGSGFGGDLPNDIAVSGKGSTEVTGAGATDSLNVQSTAGCAWKITITAV